MARTLDMSAHAMLGGSPGYTQLLEDAPFIVALDQTAFSQLLALLAPKNILVEASLVEPHALLARQKPHAAVEDVVAREVD